MEVSSKLKSNQLFKTYKDRLAAKFGEEEATALTFILFEKIFEFTKAEILAGKSMKNFNKYCFEELENFTLRLEENEPIQYILGEAFFYEWFFKVTPAVLIPRPETEELVHWVIKDYKNSIQPKILDIGTGSGCIAICLAKELLTAEVHALDVSKEALDIARANAQMLKTKVYFSQADVLSGYLEAGGFDVIVSNPPYVLQNEKPLMAPHVLDNEPHLALFVPDHDPLKFYKAIVTFAKKKLKKGGSLYLEINQKFPLETEQLLQEHGYETITVKKDLQGRFRMVKAIKGD